MSKIKIEIFDPPMCCSTGICGPTIDPALIKINAAINKIKTDYAEEAIVERHMLGKSIMAFQSNPLIIDIIKNKGTNILPVTAVNGQIIKTNGYPTLEELLEYINKA